LAFRAFGPFLPGDYSLGVEREYDPLLGWRKRAGGRAIYRRREYTVEVAINSHGLRDRERAYATPPGTFRVLALGDSFVEAYSVPLEDAVTQVLERSLRARGCAAEVINGGTNGYSTDQEYLFYQSEGVRYRPRVVLLFFHYNDVVYNERQDYFGAPKPVFEMTGDELRLHRYPVREPPARRPPSPRDDKAEEGLALFAWVRQRMWYGAPRAYSVLARAGLWSPMPKVPIRLELRVYQRDSVPEIEEAWDKTAAILGALAREVESQGARLLLVSVPSRLEVDETTWELTQALYQVDDRTWDRQQVMRRLASVAQASRVPMLDLTGPLRDGYRGWGRRPYYTYDGHWSPRGHAIAAAEIQRFLEAQRWLEPCEPSRAAR
jgi:lysophospholipase L1-like esterase